MNSTVLTSIGTAIVLVSLGLCFACLTACKVQRKVYRLMSGGVTSSLRPVTPTKRSQDSQLSGSKIWGCRGTKHRSLISIKLHQVLMVSNPLRKRNNSPA
jgi:hypothetical protein